MNQKVCLFLFLTVIFLYIASVQNVKVEGQWHAGGWIGRYLMVDYIQSET